MNPTQVTTSTTVTTAITMALPENKYILFSELYFIYKNRQLNPYPITLDEAESHLIIPNFRNILHTFNLFEHHVVHSKLETNIIRYRIYPNLYKVSNASQFIYKCLMREPLFTNPDTIEYTVVPCPPQPGPTLHNLYHFFSRLRDGEHYLSIPLNGPAEIPPEFMMPEDDSVKRYTKEDRLWNAFLNEPNYCYTLNLLRPRGQIQASENEYFYCNHCKQNKYVMIAKCPIAVSCEKCFMQSLKWFARRVFAHYLKTPITQQMLYMNVFYYCFIAIDIFLHDQIITHIPRLHSIIRNGNKCHFCQCFPVRMSFMNVDVCCIDKLKQWIFTNVCNFETGEIHNFKEYIHFVIALSTVIQTI
jgi:hypothetical protein